MSVFLKRSPWSRTAIKGISEHSLYQVYRNPGDRDDDNVSRHIFKKRKSLSVEFLRKVASTCTNKASPSDQLYEKSCTSTSLYGSVLR